MPSLFESNTENTLTLKNRFIRSATREGKASEDGNVTPRLIDIMIHLTRGGLGLIITGLASVSRAGSPGRRHLQTSEDDVLPGPTTMAEAAHHIGGKIILQIGHAGGFSQPKLMGAETLSPLAMKLENGLACREISCDEIDTIIDEFEHASILARKACFEGVQIHAAHGHLLS